AEQILRKAGLQRGNVTPRQSSEPAGTVVDQNPGPGQLVAPGSPVDIWVAAERQLKVPSVVGKAQSDAKQTLEKRGLRLGKVTKQDSFDSDDTILSQIPAAGEMVRPGDAIAVVISFRVVSVPPVVGLSQQEAERALQRGGLIQGTASLRVSDRAEGTVVDQSPAAGAAVAPGSVVNLVLAKPLAWRTFLPWIIGGLLLAAAGGVLRHSLRAKRITVVAKPDPGQQTFEQPLVRSAGLRFVGPRVSGTQTLSFDEPFDTGA